MAVQKQFSQQTSVEGKNGGPRKERLSSSSSKLKFTLGAIINKIDLFGFWGRIYVSQGHKMR